MPVRNENLGTDRTTTTKAASVRKQLGPKNSKSNDGRRMVELTSTTTWYIVPSYSRIMCRHWAWGGGLLVGKRVQEVWGKKRKKGKIIIIINRKLTGKIIMKKKEENKHKNKKTYHKGRDGIAEELDRETGEEQTTVGRTRRNDGG